MMQQLVHQNVIWIEQQLNNIPPLCYHHQSPRKEKALLLQANPPHHQCTPSLNNQIETQQD